MTVLFHLLRDGYFPKELPPVFNTIGFSHLMSSHRAALPPEFKYNKRKQLIAKMSEHNIARVGVIRRKLSIPNPIAYFLLCSKIDSNWPVLKRALSVSQLSKSEPIISGPNSIRAFSPKHPPSELTLMRAQYRLRSRYLLMTDIKDFYHSIYTHTIPWALHSKALAKEKRNPRELIGNCIDQLIRNCQDAQTMGLPVGPDTSFLLSQILLNSIDNTILENFQNSTKSNIRGFRWMDDYEICVSNSHEAEIALNCIESALSQYELGTNPSKTIIRKLPVELEDSWVRELRVFVIRDSNAQLGDIISYFSRAFELAKENPTKSILKYAINRFRSSIIKREIKKSAWPMLQDLMLECMINEPGTINYVLNLFNKFSSNGYLLETEQLEDVLNHQIISHAPLGHGSEVAWSLWGSIMFGLHIYPDAGKLISNTNDSVVALLALDAESRGLLEDPLEKDSWSQYMNQEGLYGEQWLLSYEAYIKKWIPIKDKDYVKDDPRFNYLKRNGIQFYDSIKAAKRLTYDTLYASGSYHNVSD